MTVPLSISMVATYFLMGLLTLYFIFIIHEKHPYRLDEDGHYDEIKPRDIIWLSMFWPYVFLKCVLFWWVVTTIKGIKNLVISLWKNEWVS